MIKYSSLLLVIIVAACFVLSGDLPAQSLKADESPQYQVDVQVQFVKFNKDDIEKILLKDKVVGLDALEDLWERGRASIEVAAQVTSLTGIEATSKQIEEYIYPTEFRADVAAVSNSMMAVVVPGGFKTREAGVILSVLPEVSTDLQTIALTLIAEYVPRVEWRDRKATVVIGDGSKYEVPAEVPQFFTCKVSSTIKSAAGERVIVGAVSYPDPEKIMYVFSSAHFVGLDGKPLMKRR